MSDLQSARTNIATHVSRETTHDFDVALHDAIATSLTSMTELHTAVRLCVRSLRAANVGPVEMILAMKACALDSAGRYRPKHDEYPASNVEMLMDHIIKWSISEYYTLS